MTLTELLELPIGSKKFWVWFPSPVGIKRL